MNNNISARILVLDDHSIVLNGIRLLLQLNLPYVIMEEATNENELFSKLELNVPNLLIMDLSMPNTDTQNLLQNILTKHPSLKVLIYSMNPEEIYAIRYLKAGATAYISKEAPNEELLSAIFKLLNGELYYSSQTLKMLSTEIRKTNSIENPFDTLTSREFEIMIHFLNGKSIKEITQIVRLHSSTIGTYKARIYEKLNVTNTIDLRKLAELNRVVY